ncbi:chitinase 11-like [Triticum aestivum]|uniref:chitinase 11-like n=1 Tax=Triticum aestivum TaxID=4565 RepID=UPI001D018F4F|nr:chitinase 11-like [Triticum aestivum]
MRVFGLLAVSGAALLLAAAGTASGSVASILTRDTFYSMLRQGHHGGGDGGCDGGAFYTYNAFVEAASTFRGFGTTGDQATRRRKLAAFFAQTSHETTGYCWVKQRSPAGDQYYGRGPMQLIQ